MKRKILICLLFITIVTGRAFSQKLTVWDIKLSYTTYEPEEKVGLDNKNHAITGDLNYSLTKYIELGAWLGWGFYQEGVPETGYSNSYLIYTSSMLLYGLNANINLMPLATKGKKSRLKVYLSGKLGANYKMGRENAKPARGNYFEYAAFIGASYYVTKHLGAFVEGGLSNTSAVKYGLAIKF